MSLHEIRNRIAHHEPIIAVDVAAAYCDLLRLAQLLEPALAAHIRSTSGVPARVAGRPT